MPASTADKLDALVTRSVVTQPIVRTIVGDCFEVRLGGESGEVKLPSNFLPAHLRAVREAIGSDYEIVSVDDYWRHAGRWEYLGICRRQGAQQGC
jgi:hypothetical protein